MAHAHTHAHEPTHRGTVRGCHIGKLEARMLYRGCLATAAVVFMLQKQQQRENDIPGKMYLGGGVHGPGWL